MSGINPASLPDHWELVTMGDVAKVVGGSTPKSKEPSYWDGDIAWLGVSDLTGYTDKYISRGARSITQDGYDACSTQMVPAGTVLFSSRAPIGYVTIAAEPVCTSQGFKSFVLTHDVSPDYVYWYLKFAKATAESLASGTTFKELSSKAAAQLPIPLPPLSEQRAIVAELERLLAVIGNGTANLHLAREQVKVFRRAVLQAAFGNCYRPTAMSETLPALAKDWEWSTVADEGDVQLGRMLNKERSSGPHMRPYLRVANVLDDRLDLSDVKEMDFPPGEFERYRLEPGDILLNEGQSPELLGRAAMYRGEMPGVCFQKTLLRFKAGPRVDPEFALLLFRHYLYAGRFQQETRITTGIGHLTGVRFANMEFPVPPLAQQREIATEVRRQLDGADKVEASLAASASDAEGLRMAVLRDAFAGRLTAARATTGSSADNGSSAQRFANSAPAVPVGR